MSDTTPNPLPTNGKGESAIAKMMPNQDPVDEIYIDGFSGFIARGGVVKIGCYRVVGHDSEDNLEIRQISHRLVLPVTALQELGNILQHAARSYADNAGNNK